MLERQESNAIVVLDVLVGVRDVVSPIHELCFGGAGFAQGVGLSGPVEEVGFRSIGTLFFALAAFGATVPRVLEQSVQCGPGQVQAVVVNVAN